MKKAYLVLGNGDIFEGFRFGADSDTTGELIFTTGMCGYIETLTDPSYYGQIIMQTFPLIGNYGIIENDFEGKCCAKGYIVREYCETPSNFRCQYNIDTFLKNNAIPGLCGVDTRQITKIIREYGVMNAMICDSVPESLDRLNGYRIENAVKNAADSERTIITSQNEKYRVVLIDYGAKRNIIRSLCHRDCTVISVPAHTSADEILALGADGVMLSNGPGDPADNTYEIKQIQALVGRLPVFGICLGHQLLALACNAETIKLKYGHRGANIPVRDLNGTRTYITSQNHGYAVEPDSIRQGKISFVNANDMTCEGIDYPELNAFSVQFHPEACAGPCDTSYLFDRFTAMMEDSKNASR